LYPKSGSFIIASELLDDGLFNQKVVFLVEVHAQGAYGFIVNQTMTAPLYEVFNGIGREDNRKAVIHVGGPVQEDQLQVLQAAPQIEGAYEVMPGLYLGGAWQSSTEFLEYFIENPDMHVFLGYSGWGPRQLEKEWDDGYWQSINALPGEVFMSKPMELNLLPHEFIDRFGL
jgi:putative transcriptional regulator